MKVEVNNVPNNAQKYIIARLVNSKLWYYSSFNNEEKAEQELDNLSELDDNVVMVIKE